jgi:L-lysine exporter family protein LysE/ArgO
MTLLSAGLSGFLLGGSLIIAIGAQNAFVLRQGLKREFVFVVCLICSLSDALLIAAGVAGLGALVQRSETAIQIVTIGGALFLFAYGALAFFRAAQPGALDASGEKAGTLGAAVLAALAFTFLNPHVYLDTVLLLGSLSGRYSGGARLAYGIGAALASFTWFFGLGYGARILAPLFARQSAWRVLDIGVGVVMWLIAGRLIVGLSS